MKFSVLRFPVHLEWTFLLTAVVLGYRGEDLPPLLGWVAVAFLSVLWHEVGHALAGRHFGFRSSIVLNGFGGETYLGGNMDRLSRLQSISISAAGPCFGLAAGGLAFGLSQYLPGPTPFFATLIVRDLLWVNIGWSLINLLPVAPLDGGRIAQTLLPRGNVASWLSLLVGLTTTLLTAWGGLLGPAFLFGWLTYRNFRELRAIGALPRVGTTAPRSASIAGRRRIRADEPEWAKKARRSSPDGRAFYEGPPVK